MVIISNQQNHELRTEKLYSTLPLLYHRLQWRLDSI